MFKMDIIFGTSVSKRYLTANEIILQSFKLIAHFLYALIHDMSYPLWT